MCNGSEVLSAEMNAMMDILIGALLGFGAAVFAEPVRRWIYRPKLKLEFGDDPGYRARTPEKSPPFNSFYEAEYIRIKVTNIKPAIAMNCRAYLAGC